MRVYVAGPLTSGNRFTDNVRAAIDCADRLVSAGFLPYVPHLCVFWDMVHPHPYEYWMKLDRGWLGSCDVLLRLPGRSPGSDREVLWAKELGIPVFFDERELLAWATEQRGGHTGRTAEKPSEPWVRVCCISESVGSTADHDIPRHESISDALSDFLRRRSE